MHEANRTYHPGGRAGTVQCGIFLEKEDPDMKRLLTCLLLAAALVTNTCALEVPTDTTIQNLNGS
ncbi:hypothetical protein D1641_17780 [Colidextribacter sp. OB.20]|nr:hypothetical protein [Colidextribacter sp. OB.20]